MKVNIPTTLRWDVTPREAMSIQRELAGRVIAKDTCGSVSLVAGIDVGFEGVGNKTARAAAVVLRLSDLQPIDVAVARMPVEFPYVPGLLSFREVPVMLLALERLKHVPDVIIVDGHGRAHPRRMGIASHLGVVIDVPTVGCAKSILCGEADEPRNRVGAWEPLVNRGEQVGAALRTRIGTKPVYVSVGHGVNLKRAIALVLGCCTRYRLPETTRYAHRAADGQPIDLFPAS